MTQSDKVYSCGFCGAPCDKDGNQLDEIPEGWNPDEHEHVVCEVCYAEENAKANMIRVTREMALDAGDPSLEGEWI